jgi:O-antigen/teichoic acid export membrane protein
MTGETLTPDAPATSEPRSSGSLSVARGGIFLAGGRLFEYASRLFIALLLARHLGANSYGEYVLAVSIAIIASGIAYLGLPSAMVRFVAILSKRRDPRGVWATLQIGILGSVSAGVVLGLVLFIAADPIATGIFGEPSIAELLRALAIFVPFMSLSGVLGGALRGFKRMDYSALGENVVKSVTRLALVIVLVVFDLNVLAAAVIYGISEAATTITFTYLLNREFPLIRPLGGVRGEVRGIASFSFPLWLSGLLRQFRKNIQILLLGSLGTVSAAGIFAVAARINLLGLVVYQAVLRSARPALAELLHEKNRSEAGHLYRTTTRWTFMANLPFFIIVALFAGPILSIFGRAFSTGASALVVLGLAELVNAGTGTSGTVIDMAGHTKVKLVNSVLWVVVLLVANWVLIPRWGLLGAAIAALIASVTINLLRVVEVWIFERIQPYDRSFLKPLAAGLGSAALVGAFSRFVPGEVPLAWVAVGSVLVLLVYAGLSVLLGLAPEDRTVFVRTYEKIAAAFGRGRVAA